MTTQQAINYYGSQVKLATALGLAQSTVAGWGDYPPIVRQLQLQQITKGRLSAEPGLLTVKRKSA